MCTINVCICHDDNFGVAQFFEVEFLGTNACSQCRDHVNNLSVFEYFVKPRLIYVNAFTSKRKDGLVLPIPSLFSGTTGGISFHKEELCSGGIAFRTVGEFSWHRSGVENPFAANHFSGAAGSLTCSRSINGFLNNTLGDRRIFFQKRFKLGTGETLDDTLNLRVPKFGLRLSLKLRVGNFDADDCSHSFTDIFTSEVYFCAPQEIVGGGVGFEGSGESTLKTAFMESTFSGTDIVSV